MYALLSARGIYLLWDWDELPHLTSLGLMPLFAWLLMRKGGWRTAVLASLCAGTMIAANMYGLVLVGMTVVLVSLAQGVKPWRSITIAVAGWLLVIRWAHPSLLWWLTRSPRIDPGTRWSLLFACPAILTPVLFQHAGISFVPLAGRYKVEAEPAVALVAGDLLRRCPLPVRMTAAVAILAVASMQTVAHRRFAKAMMRQAENIEARIEARTARWLHRPESGATNGGKRPAFRQRRRAIRPAAAGVRRYRGPGRGNPEFWKPYQRPGKFEGPLPAIWCEDDTTLYDTGGPGPVAAAPRDALATGPSDLARFA